jgi:hypothetical protein
MRIAQVSPLYESVPPKYYGGTERVVSYLTEELVAQGHDVTLFASGDSITRARLVACSTRSLRLDTTASTARPPHRHARAGRQPRGRVRRDPLSTSIICTSRCHADCGRRRSRHSTAGWTCRISCRSTGSFPRCRWYRFPTPSASRSRAQLGADDPPRAAAGPVHVPGAARGLPGLPRPDLAGEARGPRDPHRRAAGHAAQDRREGGHRRPRVLHRADRAAARSCRASSTSARSARGTRTSCSATPTRSSSPSTGRSPSAW